MMDVDELDHTFPTKENQTSYSCWNEEGLETEDYRLGFENAIMQIREQYDLRSKKNIDDPKPKASEITIKKNPGKNPKVTVESSKLAPESSGKNKHKDILTSDKSSQGPSSTIIAANAPNKTESNIVHNENQQV